MSTPESASGNDTGRGIPGVTATDGLFVLVGAEAQVPNGREKR
jgi:hypothetical protein